MVAEHSQESGATDSSVPVETPEAEVSSGVAQTEQLADQVRAEEKASLERPSESLTDAQEFDEAGGLSGETDGPVVDAEDVNREDQLTEASDEVPEQSAGAEVTSVADQALADEVQAADEVSSPEDEESSGEPEEAPPAKDWYILKVQVNREDSIRLALLRRIKIEGLEEHFDEIVVPTEDVVEFNKSGKRKVVRKKLYPGYILVHMAINDDTWFLIRETPGVGDFTGSAGKPTPMDAKDVERILRLGVAHEDGGREIKTSIPFKSGDRVRVKDGHFQNFEGQVDSIDEANGRITVMINIFNRSTPVELEHWQVEFV